MNIVKNRGAIISGYYNKKELWALTKFIENSQFEPDFDFDSADILSDKIIKTNDGLYYLMNIFSLDLGKLPYEYSYRIVPLEFAYDYLTFDVAEPLISRDVNMFNRKFHQLRYYRYHRFINKAIGQTSYLVINLYDYKYYKNKNHVFYIDYETASEKEARIRFENNLTTLEKVMEYKIENQDPSNSEVQTLLKVNLLADANPENWKLLNEHYSVTDDYVYYHHKRLFFIDRNGSIIYADPKSFDVMNIDKSKGKDKFGLWEYGSFVKST